MEEDIMKKRLVIASAVFVFAISSYADCQQTVSIQNMTGSPVKPGVNLTLKIVPGGNVTWTPNLTNQILSQFGITGSTISYTFGKTLKSELDVYNSAGILCEAFPALNNGCDINWGNWTCNPPFHIDTSRSSSGWVLKYYGY